MPDSHATIPEYETLDTPAQSASLLGFRMPGEWEPHDGVWVSPPHNANTWPGDTLVKAQKEFAYFLSKLTQHTPPLLCADHGIATDDSWIRDYGPIFVINDQGQRAIHDFRFNCWGTDYGPYDQDDLVPQHIARSLNLPIWVHDTVLEGGAIEVNGKGTIMTPHHCLTTDTRNPGMTLEHAETVLHQAFGTKHCVWTPHIHLAGDDTGGHVDTFCRFIAEDTIAAIRAPKTHVDHEQLEILWDALKQARDQDGKRFNLVELPVPEVIDFDYPDVFGVEPGIQRVPAGYANFLISNGGVFVPTYGQPADDLACKVLEQAMPGYKIYPIPSQWLIIGMGSLHCLSQQQPSAK
jgi:agmatine deiminase